MSHFLKAPEGKPLANRTARYPCSVCTRSVLQAADLSMVPYPYKRIQKEESFAIVVILPCSHLAHKAYCILSHWRQFHGPNIASDELSGHCPHTIKKLEAGDGSTICQGWVRSSELKTIKL